MDLTSLSRPAQEVAPQLLGCTLVRQIDGVEYRGLIVETEAYGPGDPACHGYARKTDRNAAIFGKPGSVYVYLIYGMYHCLNIVTDREGVSSAVLLRALALDRVPPWVDAKEKVVRVAAGPGKLCRALKIDRRLNGICLQPRSQLWLEPRSDNLVIKPSDIVQTTRVGLTKGADTLWRWYIKEHPSVSKRG
ncbi:DNA-3-methyladenine glycosylase [Pseudanabaena sp. PCC 6802]|uniref:DNA-3-methyladenine glycosylase n=1 Tax=Pseudanabaena sp. PCC 6802 TaxID=118173 RepID=UPI00034BF301|nr:DNA-3-methyladenine glycosylase [Pseudanabaena sp. PCC 6802]